MTLKNQTQNFDNEGTHAAQPEALMMYPHELIKMWLETNRNEQTVGHQPSEAVDMTYDGDLLSGQSSPS